MNQSMRKAAGHMVTQAGMLEAICIHPIMNQHGDNTGCLTRNRAYKKTTGHASSGGTSLKSCMQGAEHAQVYQCKKLSDHLFQIIHIFHIMDQYEIDVVCV